MNLSLLSLFNNQPDRLFRQRIDTLNIVSAQIERILQQNQLEQAQLFVSMQRFSAFQNYAARYQDLAQLCQKVTVFGVSDQPPQEMPNTQFVAVPEGSALARERFILVHHPKWRIMLVAQEPEGADKRRERQRDYLGLLTIDAKLVEQSVMMASVAAGSTTQAVTAVDPVWQQRLTTQLAMQLASQARVANLDLAPVMQEIAPIYKLCQTVTGLDGREAQLKQWMMQGQTITQTAVSTYYLHESPMLRPAVSTVPLEHFSGVMVGQGAIGQAAQEKNVRVATAGEFAEQVGYQGCQSMLIGSLPDETGDGIAAVLAFGAKQAGFFNETNRQVYAGVILGGVAGLLSATHDVLPEEMMPKPRKGASAQVGSTPVRRIRLGGRRQADGDAEPVTAVIPQEVIKLPTVPAAKVEEDPFAKLQRRMISYLVAFDRNGAEKVWREAYAQYPARDLCVNLLQPVMVGVGEGWHRGEVSIAAEHFSTGFVKSKITTLFNSYPDNPDGAVIITGCAQNEPHETGILLLSLFLRWRGHRVIYLGANVPNSTIPDAIRDVKPDMLCLSATLEEGANNLVETGELVAQADDPKPIFVFGGLIFIFEPERRETIQGNYLGDDPQTAIENIEKMLVERRQMLQGQTR